MVEHSPTATGVWAMVGAFEPRVVLGRSQRSAAAVGGRGGFHPALMEAPRSFGLFCLLAVLRNTIALWGEAKLIKATYSRGSRESGEVATRHIPRAALGGPVSALMELAPTRKN